MHISCIRLSKVFNILALFEFCEVCSGNVIPFDEHVLCSIIIFPVVCCSNSIKNI